MNLLHWPILAIIATVFFMRCAVPPLAGGSDNPDFKVTGSITDANGVPAPNTRVTMLPGSYNPVTDGPLAASMVDTTDGLGEYRLTVAKTGAYNIQALNLTKMSRLLVTGISVTGDTTRVSIAILSAPGAIKVMLPAGANTGNAYAYVPGSGVVSRARGTGDSIILDSVPAGVLPSVNYAPANDSPSSVIRYNVRVLSGDTATILNPSWRYARSIFLNTTSSGAGVADSVTGFPVLVRLTHGNFDFTQAQTGGGDIRFTKSDNSPLPYEIERFDPASQMAEIWVKVDTVKGNDSTQFIIIYWGASTPSTGSGTFAASASNGAAVFDTAEGFQAVLHMDRSAGGKTADATANHYDGVLSGGATAGSAAGPIGSACNFTGSSGNIQLTGTAKSKLSFPQYGAYTIAAWVSVDSLFTGDQHLVGKGGLQYSLRAKGSMSSPPAMFSFEEYVMTPVKGLDRRLSPITLSAWKHVVAVRNGTSAYLYIDGLCTDSTGIFYGDSNPGNARDSGSDVTIGSLIGGGLHFNGSIDEVRIMSVPLSADFVKLCYMNQRSDDKLTVFK